MPSRARRRHRPVLGVRVGVGQSSRHKTAARVAAVVEADAAVRIVAASRWAEALIAPDRVSGVTSAWMVLRGDALRRARSDRCTERRD